MGGVTFLGVSGVVDEGPESAVLSAFESLLLPGRVTGVTGMSGVSGVFSLREVPSGGSGRSVTSRILRTRAFPVASKRPARLRTHCLREIFDAIFYVLRSGCPWRMLPGDFPPWQTVFYHFRRFRLSGLWHRVFTVLRAAERKRVGTKAPTPPQPSWTPIA